MEASGQAGKEFAQRDIGLFLLSVCAGEMFSAGCWATRDQHVSHGRAAY